MIVTARPRPLREARFFMRAVAAAVACDLLDDLLPLASLLPPAAREVIPGHAPHALRRPTLGARRAIHALGL